LKAIGIDPCSHAPALASQRFSLFHEVSSIPATAQICRDGEALDMKPVPISVSQQPPCDGIPIAQQKNDGLRPKHKAACRAKFAEWRDDRLSFAIANLIPDENTRIAHAWIFYLVTLAPGP
jgi:hypothetical protein